MPRTTYLQDVRDQLGSAINDLEAFAADDSRSKAVVAAVWRAVTLADSALAELDAQLRIASEPI